MKGSFLREPLASSPRKLQAQDDEDNTHYSQPRSEGGAQSDRSIEVGVGCDVPTDEPEDRTSAGEKKQIAGRTQLGPKPQLVRFNQVSLGGGKIDGRHKLTNIWIAGHERPAHPLSPICLMAAFHPNLPTQFDPLQTSAALVLDRQNAGRKKLEASLEGLEIGATGPGRLQLVVRAGRNDVAVKLNAAEARWLASALEQWADESETIPPVRPAS